ncbi:MAG: YfhO family protein [Chitinophagaceae bacterium]|nr:YfhO family protein [Chitinophagaceae bacterium]
MNITGIVEQKHVHYKNYLLLLLICLLTYWPLTFNIFSVKNDAIHYFLPYRFNISEAIRNGEWPFWSPYIYLGNPIYGDMQSGVWNPFVWLFSCISRYNITLFHWENLLYIFLAGAGMYKLTNRLTSHPYAALLIAVSYMLSGFMLSGQLINWLASAAFIPFVVHYYTLLLNTARNGYAIKTGIALFLLFTAGYPSFFITTCYILIFLFIFTIVGKLRLKESKTTRWSLFSLQHLLLALVFLGLSLPAIVSYIDLLPYYQRGSGISYTEAAVNSFEWQHFLSILFPSSISATDISSSTDITFRNIYTGIFSLLLLFAFPPKLNCRNILLISLALFAILFSLGNLTPFRRLCYDYLPLMNTFRHPSQARLFLIFAILLLATPGVSQFIKNYSNLQILSKVNLPAITITGIILLLTITAIIQSGIPVYFSHIYNTETTTSIKNIIDNISFSDAVIINGIIQLVFIATFAIWIRRRRRRKIWVFSFLWIGNLFIMSQLTLPSTFVGKTTPREINTLINHSPTGYPTEGLKNTISENSKNATDDFNKIALSYFYNKKIGISKTVNSPSFLQQQEQFIKNELLYNYIASFPVAYIADQTLSLKDSNQLRTKDSCHYAITDTVLVTDKTCDNLNKAQIIKLSANKFEIETEMNRPGFLVLTQNYNHNWKATVDERPAMVYKTNLSFMGIGLATGKHKIIFEFSPINTIKAIWVMCSTIFILLLLGTVSLVRQSKAPTTD